MEYKLEVDEQDLLKMSFTVISGLYVYVCVVGVLLEKGAPNMTV